MPSCINMHACERCYSRKTKCDRGQPQCSSCLKSRSLCQYTNKRRVQQFEQGYLKLVEERLQCSERENERLRGYLSSQLESAGGHDDGSSDSRQPVNRGHSTELHRFEASQSPARFADSLQRAPGEGTGYLGSSNGVDFVAIVERAVDPSHTDSLSRRVTDARGAPERVAFPYTAQPAVLVDKELAMPLIMSYFGHWHLTFPLLHRPSFMQMVERLYSEPDVYRRDAACAFAFDIVLALGSTPSKRVGWSVGDAESHSARALTHLDALSGLQDIRFLQALLLYCKYGIHASLRDTSSEMWELIGKATRLCVELGLHSNSSTVLPKCDTHITGQIPILLQVEMQRRCFWCYHNLERIVNISLGRPLGLHDDDIHVPTPSALDNDSLNLTHADIPTPWTISPFLQHIQLRRIQAKIHRFMYTSRSIQVLPLRERQTVRREIFNELQAWRNSIPLLQLPSEDNASAISSAFLHPSWYQAVYHSACLMLFRPSATFPAMEGLGSDEEVDDVLRIIWNSSRHVLAKYVELLRARHLNYSWVCLYTIFMAGLANVYSVGHCVQRRKRGIVTFLPSYLDVISDVRDCSNILTAICERWDDARSSCDIFNRLSMGALKELAVVSFQQNPEQTVDSRRDAGVNQMMTQPASVIAARQEPASTVGPPLTPAHQTSLPLGPLDTAMTLDQYPNGPFSDLDANFDFQQLFQDVQNSIYTSDSMQTNEVMLGFSQEWFEQ